MAPKVPTRERHAGITSGRRFREAVSAYVLLAPALVVFGFFAFWPLWRLIHYALHQQNNNGTRERYVGFSQITDTLTGSEFRQGLGVNLKFLVFTVPLGVTLGLLLAVAAHRRLRGIKFFQTVFSSTVASSVAVSAVVFFTLVNPNVGYFQDVGWLRLDRPLSALFAVSLSSVWRNLGVTFVIVLAGLQAVPDEIIEAATLDGYGPVRRFFKITVPLISPTLLFLAVVLTVDALQAFAQMELLTGGGPGGSTETILYKITKLTNPRDFGTGAAMSLGLFVLTAIVAAAQFGVLNRRVHYGE
jgi:sn-glycerol 3-phosphate transport system permease protein